MEEEKIQINVEIEKKSLSGFTTEAINELKNQSIKLTEHLAEETLVLVSDRKVDKDGQPEITANDVKIAVTRPKSPPKRRKVWPIAVQALSPIIIFFAGKFWNTENETLLFIIIFVLITIMGVHICSLATDQYE